MVNMDDVKKEVGALDTSGKMLLFGGVAALIGCLLEWYGVTVKGVPGGGAIPGGLGNYGVDGWDCWNGKFALIGLLAAVGTFAHEMFGSVDAAKKALYPKIQLGGTGLAVLMALWFWLRSEGGGNEFVSAGTSFGFWLTLIAAGAATFGAFKRFQAAGAAPPSSPE